MGGFRLLTYAADTEDGSGAAGVLIGERVHDAAVLAGEADGSLSALQVLRRWEVLAPVYEKAAGSPPGGGTALDETELLAPLPAPPNLFFAGANYWDHMQEMAGFIKEMTGSEPPVEKLADPVLNIKAASSVVGPGAEIRLPAFSDMVDWEAEVALVVGRTAKALTPENALDALAGYTIANDVSARDFIKREGSPFIYDWLGQKSFDTSCPLGPWVTPVSAVADPDDMAIKLWVNDALKQDSNTGKLVHNFVEILVYLSGRLTLRPGDVILTGTPAGVGMPKGEFLKPGDTVRIEVGGCGTLENPVVQGD